MREKSGNFISGWEILRVKNQGKLVNLLCGQERLHMFSNFGNFLYSGEKTCFVVLFFFQPEFVNGLDREFY